MELNWAHMTSNVYGLALFMVVAILPIVVAMFAIRVVNRSAKKTIRSFRK